nr:uncharacterized protein CTRU02_03553 [Colletotrichum truncatum]KAF6796575.1 hypothetical protein CTRU02_03553 [Colletotrichum truncatum]
MPWPEMTGPGRIGLDVDEAVGAEDVIGKDRDGVNKVDKELSHGDEVGNWGEDEDEEENGAHDWRQGMRTTHSTADCRPDCKRDKP